MAKKQSARKPPTPKTKRAANRSAHASSGNPLNPISSRAETRGDQPSRARQDARVQVAGVSISHPERVVYPDTGDTKLDVARYYEQVAPAMLPHLAGRPLSLVRCPEGQAHDCFFQKHLGPGMSSEIDQVEIREKDGTGVYPVVNRLTALLSLVQFGVLEFHVWGARADRLEQPDRIVFDLDPDPDLPWPRVVEGARAVRVLLEQLGLRSWVKTTGGKGLHVVAPIDRRDTWPAVKEFCRAAVDALVRARPNDYTSNLSKAARRGKIFVDYLRNERGATWVAPYSTRARAGATVSTPLDWSELTARLNPAKFTIHAVPKRIAEQARDPWEQLSRTRQTITIAARRTLGLGS